MKKALSLFVAILMAFSMAACTSKESSSVVEESVIESNINEDVTVIIPRTIFFTVYNNDSAQEYLDSTGLDAYIKEFIENPDGSISIIFSYINYRLASESMINRYESEINRILERYTQVISISYNEDFTILEIVTDKDDYSFAAFLPCISVGGVGCLSIQAWNLVENPQVNVIVLSETGEELANEIVTYDFLEDVYSR